MGGRYALLIGNGEYSDERLPPLRTAAADIRAMGAVLEAPDIGGFQVTRVVDGTSSDLRSAVDEFYTGRRPDDTLLFYYSGHGDRDDPGRLYLCARDTVKHKLRATALPAEYLSEYADESRSKRQVIILDCCHSGAFLGGIKGAAVSPHEFEGNGTGRVILTASAGAERALEGHRVMDSELSLFTHFLVSGVADGAADLDENGRVTIDEWYDYAYSRVRATAPGQTPSRSIRAQQGQIVISQVHRSLRVEHGGLPEHLYRALTSTSRWERLDAVRELRSLARGGDPTALAAREGLRYLTRDADADVQRASETALSVLEAQRAERPVPREKPRTRRTKRGGPSRPEQADRQERGPAEPDAPCRKPSAEGGATRTAAADRPRPDRVPPSAPAPGARTEAGVREQTTASAAAAPSGGRAVASGGRKVRSPSGNANHIIVAVLVGIPIGALVWGASSLVIMEFALAVPEALVGDAAPPWHSLTVVALYTAYCIAFAFRMGPEDGEWSLASLVIHCVLNVLGSIVAGVIFGALIVAGWAWISDDLVFNSIDGYTKLFYATILLSTSSLALSLSPDEDPLFFRS